MTEKIHTKVMVLGSGPAGYTAAIYTARANLGPLLVQGIQPGGQMTITTDVENYPGFEETIQGPWLMEQMQKQAANVGTKIVQDHIKKADLSQRPFRCEGESGTIYTSDVLIICTGAQAKWLGLPSEEKYKGFGVSGCATCDGFFFRGKEVLIIGGGNTAVEEALFLTHHASHVTLVHRRDTLRAERIMQERLFSNPKVTVMWDHALEEVLGEEDPLNVTGAKLKHVKTGAITTKRTDGIFIAIGHKPNTDIFKGQLSLDAEGYIITQSGTVKTNIPGVFAAGDVQDKIYRQAVTAAGTGCMAALDADKFLNNLPGH